MAAMTTEIESSFNVRRATGGGGSDAGGAAPSRRGAKVAVGEAVPVAAKVAPLGSPKIMPSVGTGPISGGRGCTNTNKAAN